MNSVVLVVLDLAMVSALLWLFDVPYRQYRIDLLRYQLFGAQDALFMAARDGVISFNDPAYAVTRKIIDGMMLFADQVGVWQLLLMRVTRRLWEIPQEQEKFARHLAEARSALTSNQIKVIDDVLNRAHDYLLWHVAHTSLCLFPFAVGMKATARVFGTLAMAKSSGIVGKPLLDWFDRQAYEIGERRLLPEAV